MELLKKDLQISCKSGSKRSHFKCPAYAVNYHLLVGNTKNDDEEGVSIVGFFDSKKISFLKITEGQNIFQEHWLGTKVRGYYNSEHNKIPRVEYSQKELQEIYYSVANDFHGLSFGRRNLDGLTTKVIQELRSKRLERCSDGRGEIWLR